MVSSLRLACQIVWPGLVRLLCLLSPRNFTNWTAIAFVGRLGKFTKVVLALILVTAILLRVADLISHEVLGRPFDLIFDAHLLTDGGNVLSGAMGTSVSLGLAYCWLR